MKKIKVFILLFLILGCIAFKEVKIISINHTETLILSEEEPKIHIVKNIT